MAQNSNVSRSQEDYITQVSEEIEGRVKKNLSQEFNRTENRILGALAQLDDFLMNPLIQGYSGTAPETSRNAFGTNQRTNEEDSQSDPHPEAGNFRSQITQNSGPDIGHDMVIGVHEELIYCSPSTPPGKQKRNRSTNQLQFRSEDNPAKIEADQILLAFQQFANNNKSLNFHYNLNRISEMQKSLTTTMPSFEWKSGKFELFEDFFQMSFKIHNQLTEDDWSNYYHSFMKGDALQTFENIIGPNRENLGEILAVFRRKYVKPQPMATTKHKF